jgi:hypothetical protein
VIANNNVIETLIEVKTSDDLISKGLRYFYDKYGAKNKAEHIQLVHSLKQEYEDAGIKVLKLNKYLSNLYL